MCPVSEPALTEHKQRDYEISRADRLGSGVSLGHLPAHLGPSLCLLPVNSEQWVLSPGLGALSILDRLCGPLPSFILLHLFLPRSPLKVEDKFCLVTFSARVLSRLGILNVENSLEG